MRRRSTCARSTSAVERLEQRYLRLDDDGERRRYHYTSPRFGFECELGYDASGLVLDYPGHRGPRGVATSRASSRRGGG